MSEYRTKRGQHFSLFLALVPSHNPTDPPLSSAIYLSLRLPTNIWLAIDCRPLTTALPLPSVFGRPLHLYRTTPFVTGSDVPNTKTGNPTQRDKATFVPSWPVTLPSVILTARFPRPLLKGNLCGLSSPSAPKALRSFAAAPDPFPIYNTPKNELDPSTKFRNVATTKQIWRAEGQEGPGSARTRAPAAA